MKDFKLYNSNNFFNSDNVNINDDGNFLSKLVVVRKKSVLCTKMDTLKNRLMKYFVWNVFLNNVET